MGTSNNPPRPLPAPGQQVGWAVIYGAQNEYHMLIRSDERAAQFAKASNGVRLRIGVLPDEPAASAAAAGVAHAA